MELENRIFSISSPEEFEQIALDVYRFQSERCVVYRSFVQAIKRKEPETLAEIPFLPISFFKTHDVIAQHQTQPELLFLSSGTTGMERSRHLVLHKTLYERSFFAAYRQFIGNPEEQIILALLPNYLEQGNSSLVYMVDGLIKASNTPLSGFVLNSPELVVENYQKARNSGKKVVIFGVSYALLDLAEQNLDLSEAFIIETGGMKGRRKELTKEELHTILQSGLHVPFISSEYGMTELLSQAYSNQQGIFTTPDWMKILIRETNDPFQYTGDQKTGGINVIDLANLYSCSFIATQDLGKTNGNQFQIMGRFDHSDIRGCNLLVE